MSAHFFEDTATADWKRGFFTTGELRLRTTDATDRNGALRNISSDYIHRALRLFDCGATYEIPIPELREAVEQMDTIRNSPSSVYTTNKKLVFKEIEELANRSDIDPDTQQCASMVLEGAKTFAPDLTS